MDNYSQKIEIILSNRLEYNGDNRKHIEDVKTWLCCEWQCGAIEDMDDYLYLCGYVDDIVARMVIRGF